MTKTPSSNPMSQFNELPPVVRRVSEIIRGSPISLPHTAGWVGTGWLSGGRQGGASMCPAERGHPKVLCARRLYARHVLKRLSGASLMAVLLLSGCSSMTPAAKASAPSTPVPQVSATVIDGVPLTPITAGQWRECQQAADATHAPVPCPTLLPVPMPGSLSSLNCANPSLPICGRPSIGASGTYFLVNQYSFEVPDGYIGYVPGIGHFVVMSARHFNARADPALRPTPIPGYCALVPQLPPLVVHRSIASMYECGQDPGPSAPIADQYMETVSGHEMVEWRQAGVTCEVSFHGHATVNQDLAVAVAQSTHMVIPLSG